VRFAHALLESSFHDDRHREPEEAVWSLDSIPVAPVAFGELRVVVQHELIDGCDEIEITLPRYVTRLDDGDAFGHEPLRF